MQIKQCSNRSVPMRLRDKVVLVTGVTGTAGDKIARRCVSEGAEVKGLIRNRDQIVRCEELGITPVIGDLTDRAVIAEALRNVNIIIHAAAYLGEDRVIAEASNIQGCKVWWTGQYPREWNASCIFLQYRSMVILMERWSWMSQAALPSATGRYTFQPNANRNGSYRLQWLTV